MRNQGDAASTGDTGTGVTSVAGTAAPERSESEHSDLQPVSRRGRLVLADYYSDRLELETAHGRIELLGPFVTEAYEGDEVEVIGLPDPTSRGGNGLPALLIQHMRRLS